MNLSKFIKWLNREIPRLVDMGLIAPENAERIREHYRQELNSKGGINIVLGIFAVIGAVCIGLGVILFFAFNWDNFSRFAKTCLAVMPVIISLSLFSWAFLTEKKRFSVREGLSIASMLSLGAAHALISQIYHIPGELHEFLLLWMFLSIPFIYLLSSTVSAVFYLTGISAWVVSASFSAQSTVLFWPLLGAAIPYFYRHLSSDRFSMSSQWLSFFMCIALFVGVMVSLFAVNASHWIVVCSAFFAALYLAGKLWFDDGDGFWQRPFRNYGMLGLVILAYVFTFDFVWEFRAGDIVMGGNFMDPIVLLSVILAAVAFLVFTVLKRKFFEVAFGVMPIITAIFYFFAINDSGLSSVLSAIFSLYLFLLGCLCIYYGVKEIRLDLTNSGIFISGLVLLTRFLSSSGILERSIVFIVVGAAFVFTNMFLSARLKRRS